MGAMPSPALYSVPGLGGAPLEIGLRQRQSARFGLGSAGLPSRAPCGLAGPGAGYRRPCRILTLGVGMALLFILSSPASFGADYYFSSCAAGGQGTKASPWCLDPDGDGTRESIMYLFDGTAPEAAPGDNISLCAGTCDGSGSATYRPNRTGSNVYWFCANRGGSSGLPITIQNYPGETVVISGDSDGNGSYAGPPDVDTLITNACRNGIEYITWKGNDVPGNGQEKSKGLVLEKSGGRMVTLDTVTVPAGTDYDIGGPDGWIFDGLIFRYSGSPMWNGVTPPISFFASGCSVYDVGAAAIKVAALTGPFTVQNSIVHSVCGFIHRNTNNDGGGGQFLFQNNEYYNAASVSEDFLNIRSSDHSQYASFIWRGNYVHDVYGAFHPKDRTRDYIIEDNTIACLGEYKLFADGRCGDATVVDESTSGDYTGTTYNVTIRRNKIFSVATSPSFSTCSTCPSSCCGWFLEDVIWRTTCDPAKGYCTKSGGLIENNMIWNHYSATGGECEKGAICVTSNNDDVTVRNNTIFGGNGYGISLIGSGRNYPVYNNLVMATGLEPIHTGAGYSSGTGLTFNNTWRASGNVYDGAIVKTCSQVPSFGIGNNCAQAQLLNTSGAVGLFDLHLAPGDTVDRGTGTIGPSDDVDRQFRIAPIDLGADQALPIDPTDTVAPPAPGNLRFL